jgi:lysophosphatidate acyltransferase
MGFLHGLAVYVLIPYAVVTLSLFAVAEFLPPTILPARYANLPGFLARALAYIFGLIICASYGTITSIGLNLVGMSGLSQWTTAKAFKWVMWPLVQVWFDVEDETNASSIRPAVFLGNHQT